MRSLFSVPRSDAARCAVRRTLLSIACVAPACAATAAPAMAAEPPALGHQVISFPARDFVSATGYAQGVPAVVQVTRKDPATGKQALVAQSTSVMPQDDPGTPGFDGLVEVNHPGGGCWTNITPDIRAGDKIRITQRDSAGTVISDDITTTAFVTVGRPEVKAGTSDVVVIKGTAQSMTPSTGTPLAKQIPLAQIEQRLISSKDPFAVNGRRDLRAPGSATGGNGTLKYDVPNSTTNFDWTATYTLSDPADVQRALAAESRILWLGRVPANANEMTIMENGPAAVAGPSPPCTAPLEGTSTTPVAPKPPAPETVPVADTVLDAPAAGHILIPFPARDFVSAEGYRPGVPATVNVFRPDSAGLRTLVGSATVTPGADGLVEVNHPGGGCWVDQTPNIRAGDVVRITQQAADGRVVAEETKVANVVAKAARKVTFASTGQVAITVDGTAATGGTEAAPAGDRIPLAQLEQRLVNADLFAKNGKRTLRAPGDGTLRYVGTTGYAWRATYTGLSDADMAKAVASESRGMWLGTDPLAGNQLTIFEIGDGIAGGPAAPCTAPAEAN